MRKQQSLTAVPDETIINKIYQIRGQKVMLDRDLALLYGVEAKRLKETVRRNLERFPEDFMLELNEEEFKMRRTVLQNQEPRRQIGYRRISEE
jgi:hypothetical protein